MEEAMIDLASLDGLFRPRSIAVLGASTTPRKIGGQPVASLRQNGYRGDIYPINARSDVVQGLQAYPSILDVPDAVDLAICAVPGQAVQTVLSECAEKGVKALIVFSAGFAEVDEDGARAQAEITALVRDAGMRMLGPNSMGMVNFADRVVGSFHPSFADNLVAGRIGLVSQSGAFGASSYILARARRQSLSFMLTTGNEADVDLSDCLAFLAEDANTDVILLYMEGCRCGQRFIEALERARANGKPVVALKLGRTESGAAAAASHTAALAGEDAVYDSIFRQFGVYRAYSVEEFFDIGRACVIGKPPLGDRVGLVSMSGGVGVLMADDAEARGLDVAPMPEDAQAELRQMVPFGGPRNLIDVTAQVVNDPALMDRSVDLVCAAGNYDSVISFQGSFGRNPATRDMTLAGWKERKRKHPDIYFAAVGFAEPDYYEEVESYGVVMFEEPTHATRSVAAMRTFAKAYERGKARPAVGAPSTFPAGRLDEAEALIAVSEAGIEIPTIGVATNAKQAVELANKAGYPVAAKVLSPDILHKSDIGGVKLGLRNAAEVEAAYHSVIAAGDKIAGAEVRGCLIAPMLSDGVETILGVQHDPIFGPIVMFGLGGVFVEALKDVTFRVAPFDVDEAHAMIREINAFPILTGLRGQPSCDLDALAKALSRLSVFAKANEARIASLDVNPYLVTDNGGIALDAAFVMATP